MKEKRISPAGFALLQETLMRSEIEGYGPDACAMHALNSVGLPHEPTKFIVDYSLDGPVYPFMAWPDGWR